MKTSITVKILIALFLGAFIWFVVVSIQTPKKNTAAQETVELREELLNRAEGVTVEMGDVRIQADVQETYRNMEVHYQGFTITRENETRSMVITGKTAQMKSQGSDVSFIEMEGNVHVETSDGLILDSDTLNYEDVQKRIFSNTPVIFSLNNLSGKSEVFIFYTESRLLHMHGRVDCILLLDEDVDKPKAPKKRVRIRCNSLDYDQENHLLTLTGNVKVAQSGSYLSGKRLEAFLTEDNRQFTQMKIYNAETVEIPEEVSEESITEEESQAGISYHAGGIKNLKAKELTLGFVVGPGNPLAKVTADENARLHIAPTSRQIQLGKTEEKKISGDTITANMGADGQGIKTIHVNSREGKSKLDIRESRVIRQRRKAETVREKNLKKPRVITAKEFNAKVDEETGEITEVVMTGGTTLTQGDLKVTGRSGRYIAGTEKLTIEGSPVLIDNIKRVTGRRMVVSLDIGDLTAEGKVESIFSPPKKSNKDNPGIFSIAGGGKSEKTTISSETLRFDYKKNILRYAGNVVVSQGNTLIRSNELDILQDSSKLIATGGVSAELTMGGEKPAEKKTNKQEEQPDEGQLVSLSGEMLEISNNDHRMRIKGKAKSTFEGMVISGRIITYNLDTDDSLLNFVAEKDVRIDLEQKQINGDKARFNVKEKVLSVTGKVVKYLEEGKLEGSYSKLVYNTENGSMEFFARGDQLVKTKILK